MAITTFIPKVWDARLLEHLDNSHVYGRLVNRDYEGDIRDCGDSVKINQLGAITISDYTRNADISAPQELTTTDQMLVINQSKSFNFQLDDVDKAQAKASLIDKAMQRSAYALAEVSDKFIAKTIKESTDVPTLVVANALTKETAYEFMIACKKQLDDNNVPREGRFIVVPTELEGLLLQDVRLVQNGGTLAEDLKIKGYVGTLLGFTIYTSNNVPFDSTKKEYTVIGGVSEGCTFAEQIVKTEAYRLEKRFADAIKGLNVYGAKVVQPTALFKADVKFNDGVAKKKA